MKRFLLGPFLATCILTSPVLLRAQQNPATTTPATEPRPRDDARHQSFLETAKAGNIDVLFVGDSITDLWRRPGPARGLAVWDEHSAPLRAANFRISGHTYQG